jgi:hypothetical protein
MLAATTTPMSKRRGHDHTPISPPREVPVDLNRILQDAIVVVGLYGYTVDFGPSVQPRLHQVGKDKHCSCPQGADCPAIEAVTDYLRKGGERAPDPPAGFLVTAPETCPICGAPAYFDPVLISKVRGAGWGCAKAKARHYYQWRSELLRQALSENPWRFPPVVLREGTQTYAWDGIKQDDIVLYEGVLRADLVTEGPIGYLE